GRDRRAEVAVLTRLVGVAEAERVSYFVSHRAVEVADGQARRDAGAYALVHAHITFGSPVKRLPLHRRLARGRGRGDTAQTEDAAGAGVVRDAGSRHVLLEDDVVDAVGSLEDAVHIRSRRGEDVVHIRVGVSVPRGERRVDRVAAAVRHVRLGASTVPVDGGREGGPARTGTVLHAGFVGGGDAGVAGCKSDGIERQRVLKHGAAAACLRRRAQFRTVWRRRRGIDRLCGDDVAGARGT